MCVRLSALVCILVFTSQVWSQSLQSEIDSLMSAYVVDQNFMGSILIADQGEVVFAKGYGLADVDRKVPNTPETKFLIGSITKQFTAVLVMQLVEQGKLSLDDKIGQYLPQLPVDIGDRITIEMLLSHTSGLPLPEGIEEYYHLVDVDSYIRRAVDVGLRFEPGEGYGYSNTGFAILAVIIEKVTGQAYEDVLRQQILVPLGMSNTGCNKRGLTLENRAYSYIRLPEGYVGWSEEQSFDPGVVFFGSGFLYSTVEDLFRFSKALYANELLSKKYMDMHTKMRVEKPLPPIPGITEDLASDIFGKCGSGFVGEIAILGDAEGEGIQTLFWHDGTMRLFKGYNLHSSRNDQYIIILSNCSLLVEGNEIALKILRMINNQPYAHIGIRHRLRQYIEDEVAMHAGIATAVEEYLRLKDDTVHFIVPDQRYLYWAGGLVAERGDYEGAVLILQAFVSQCPDSWEGYDALAQTHLLLGDTVVALQHCRRSLELNPQNDAAREMLRQFGED